MLRRCPPRNLGALQLGFQAAPAENKFAQQLAIVEALQLRRLRVGRPPYATGSKELPAVAERQSGEACCVPESCARARPASRSRKRPRKRSACHGGPARRRAHRRRRAQRGAARAPAHRAPARRAPPRGEAAWWKQLRLLRLPLEDYEDERSALAGLDFASDRRPHAAQAVRLLRIPACRSTDAGPRRTRSACP